MKVRRTAVVPGTTSTNNGNSSRSFRPSLAVRVADRGNQSKKSEQHHRPGRERGRSARHRLPEERQSRELRFALELELHIPTVMEEQPQRPARHHQQHHGAKGAETRAGPEQPPPTRGEAEP